MASATEPSRAMTKAPQQYPSLDGLRAVSFMFVFVAHSGLEKVVPGGFGVTTFFYLSGFLITTLMRLEERKTGTVSLKGFYIRRVFRILPPFYLTLLAATLLCLAGVVPGVLRSMPMTALAGHFGNYWFASHGSEGVPAGTGVYWSLAVEEHFYLLFPLLYLATRKAGLKGRSQGAFFLLLCAIIVVWRSVLVLHFGVPEDRTYLCSDTRFDSILFGCTLAVAMNPVVDKPTGSERLWKRVLFPAGVVLLLGTFIYRAPWFRESIRYTLQGIGLTPIFVVGMRFPDWGPFRLLNHRLVAFLGVLTYSLYLVHQVVLFTVHAHLPGWNPVLLSLLALALSILYSLAMYRYVEQPFARLRKRFSTA
jgi:peptidoglycan/LPS O-acetylase OafA/YrhL